MAIDHGWQTLRRFTAPRLAPTALAIAALAIVGCSLSYSSESSSDSVTSSSKSASSSFESSSDGDSEEDSTSAYRNDVAGYTEAYVSSRGSDRGFLRGIGTLAGKRGLSDWEADDNTWHGIGAGLARVGISEDQLATYKQNWADGDTRALTAIQRGYDDARR